MTPQETKLLIEKIKKINLLLGKEKKTPTKSEIRSNNIKTFRRAVYFNKDMKKGSVIKEKDLTYLRPNHGVDAKITKNNWKKNFKKYKSFFKIELKNE